MTTYLSTLAYESGRIRAAALYCSDGRVGEHFDDFLHHGLHLPRYDRIALPGGPALLSPTTPKRFQLGGVVDHLRFLIEVHGLRRMVLLAHEGCAFYAEKLNLARERMAAAQRADLIRAAEFIRGALNLDAVEAYFACHVRGGIGFETVAV